MSMNQFADTISYALKAPQVDRDIASTLEMIHKISDEYYGEDTNDLKSFLKRVQPKIEYLFWKFQNEENQFMEQQLSEIFEQFDKIRERYLMLKKNRKSTYGQLIDEPSPSKESVAMTYYDEEFELCLLWFIAK